MAPPPSELLRDQADVVIVGSGAGGATLACALAEAGLDVIILEEGGLHRTRDFGTHVHDSIRNLYRDAGGSFMLGRPPILFSEGRCVGGSTVINGGMSWETPENILHRWETDHGLTGIMDEAEELFAIVNQDVSVAMQPAGTIGGDSILLKAGADKLGYRTIDALRNQDRCMGTNNCAWGCPTGGKQSMLVTTIPRALQAGARLYPDCRVDRITMSHGRATGVSGRFVDSATQTPGPRISVEARCVVSACGAIQTPALLARSGLRKRLGPVGENFLCHPNAKVIGIFPDSVGGWKGTIQGWQVREFIEDGILVTTSNIPPAIAGLSLALSGERAMEIFRAYDRMLVAGCLVEDSITGKVRVDPTGRPWMTYQLTDWDLERLCRGIYHTSEMLFAAGAERILLPFHGIDDLTSPDDLPRLLDPSLPRKNMEVLTVHAMGTCRMDADPSRSVLDVRGRCHGLDNLYITDASMFPSAIGVNPQITIMMLALRTARTIVADLGKD